MEDSFSTDSGGGDGSGGNANDGEWWGAADARPSPPAVQPGS